MGPIGCTLKEEIAQLRTVNEYFRGIFLPKTEENMKLANSIHEICKRSFDIHKENRIGIK